MDKRKEAKKIANKRYYEQTKAKLRELNEIKNEIKPNTEEENFFFRQNQNQKKEPPLPEVKPQPQQIIVQAPPPVKVNLKTRILETTILSMIPILPMLIKQFMIILQTRQQKSEQEQETQPNMRYVATNSLDF